jgi:hypothetical protein
VQGKLRADAQHSGFRIPAGAAISRFAVQPRASGAAIRTQLSKVAPEFCLSSRVQWRFCRDNTRRLAVILAND